jgi:2,6-dihydroxypyridine 3-monooxygenase
LFPVNSSTAEDKLDTYPALTIAFYHGRNTQILCYLIPGPTGELSEGERRLNWVWYVNVSEGNKLQSLLTDRYGAQREFSVPQEGMVRDDFVQQQKSIAERILPRVFGQLVVQTNEPFKQYTIRLYPERHLGEFVYWVHAAFVSRPHTAARLSKAATNAVALANSFADSSNVDIIQALKGWEPRQIEFRNNLKYLGISLGNRTQFNQN